MDPNENPRTIKMYICGPTVYSDAHIGHARTYMIVDLINRTLNKVFSKPTHLVMNITDIDDNIIRDSKIRNIEWIEIARYYEKSFFDSMDKLGITKPDSVIRVSESIGDIVKYIQKIIDNGFAYVVSNGSVYFDTEQYKKVGYEFSEFDDTDEEIYESGIPKEILAQKKNYKDFTLWKNRPVLEVGFNVDFSYDENIITSHGVPGWHIECSAMIHVALGETVDIHFGGKDLKFPHHHNEQLQANAFYHPTFHPIHQHKTSTLTKWTHDFIHIGLLNINGKKMSKSIGGCLTINDVLNQINKNQFRWLFMVNKWSQSLEFTDDLMKQAISIDATVKTFFRRILNSKFEIPDKEFLPEEINLENDLYRTQQRIIEYLKLYKFEFVVRCLMNLISITNSYMDKTKPNESIIKKIFDYIRDIISKLGFSYRLIDTTGVASSNKLNSVMTALINTRTELRKLARQVDTSVQNKIYSILDTERDIDLQTAGITLEDTSESSIWYEKTEY